MASTDWLKELQLNLHRFQPRDKSGEPWVSCQKRSRKLTNSFTLQSAELQGLFRKGQSPDFQKPKSIVGGLPFEADFKGKKLTLNYTFSSRTNPLIYFKVDERWGTLPKGQLHVCLKTRKQEAQRLEAERKGSLFARLL